VPRRLLHAVVPTKIMMAVCEIDIFLLEDCCPSIRCPWRGYKHWQSLKRHLTLTMESLTCSTMTVLDLERVCLLYLELNLTAMTTSFKFRLERTSVLDLVWGTELPLILLAFRKLVSRLIVMSSTRVHFRIEIPLGDGFETSRFLEEVEQAHIFLVFAWECLRELRMEASGVE
jgi:hypothetical protein